MLGFKIRISGTGVCIEVEVYFIDGIANELMIRYANLIKVDVSRKLINGTVI